MHRSVLYRFRSIRSISQTSVAQTNCYRQRHQSCGNRMCEKHPLLTKVTSKWRQGPVEESRANATCCCHRAGTALPPPAADTASDAWLRSQPLFRMVRAVAGCMEGGASPTAGSVATPGPSCAPFSPSAHMPLCHTDSILLWPSLA